MQRNLKTTKEELVYPQVLPTMETHTEVDSALTENERFVKKLEIQIEIIRKIIDPVKDQTLIELNDDGSLK
jgi:hypothetical protein